MKIYKVYFEELAYDTGRFQGYATKGYYTTKERAEEVKDTIKEDIVTGKAYIEEIEVED